MPSNGRRHRGHKSPKSVPIFIRRCPSPVLTGKRAYPPFVHSSQLKKVLATPRFEADGLQNRAETKKQCSLAAQRRKIFYHYHCLNSIKDIEKDADKRVERADKEKDLAKAADGYERAAQTYESLLPLVPDTEKNEIERKQKEAKLKGQAKRSEEAKKYAEDARDNARQNDHRKSAGDHENAGNSFGLGLESDREDAAKEYCEAGKEWGKDNNFEKAAKAFEKSGAVWENFGGDATTKAAALTKAAEQHENAGKAWRQAAEEKKSRGRNGKKEHLKAALSYLKAAADKAQAGDTSGAQRDAVKAQREFALS